LTLTIVIAEETYSININS